MRSLPVPNRSAIATLTSAISSFTGVELLAFQNIKYLIEAAEAEYHLAGQIPDFSKIIKSNTVGGVSKEVLSKLYEKQLATPRGSARQAYNELREMAPFGICPLCGVGKVSTLDHYLPKNKYPIFAVTPVNLVPCCRDCNWQKDRSTPRI